MAVDDFQNAIDNKKEEEEIKQEEFQESHIEEVEIYYRLGIKTGFNLAQELS